MASDGHYLLLGCQDCNNYRGRVEIYAVLTGKIIGTINNQDNDNLQMGTDIVSLGNEIFHVGSISGGMMNVRQFYSNVVRVSKNSRSQYEI
jgi:hypothetical protein